jgi:glutaredoxin 3
MLTLYYKPTCPFCQRVLGEIEGLAVDIDLKDMSADEATVAELVSVGGKRQVPFLIDHDHQEQMYESNDIIEYLKAHYSGDRTD